MYRHILIATDGSALAQTAVSHGLSLAKAIGAKVTALIVETPFNVYDVPSSRVQQMSEAYTQHASKSDDMRRGYWIVSRTRQTRLVSLARQCRPSTIIPIKRSSRPQRIRAAISS
jgi:nucleotide-binding universal stress UspA family protein